MACVLQSSIILPLFPFNPLSLLPVITSVLLMLTLFIAPRGRRVAAGKAVIQEVRKSATYA
jgi:hypothetical protein